MTSSPATPVPIAKLFRGQIWDPARTKRVWHRLVHSIDSKLPGQLDSAQLPAEFLTHTRRRYLRCRFGKVGTGDSQ